MEKAKKRTGSLFYETLLVFQTLSFGINYLIVNMLQKN
jgi:hypothetical protein